MGLDRTAGALLIARSDAPGSAAAHEIALMAERAAPTGRSEVFTTNDADEGEAFAVARRAAFPAMERRGHAAARRRRRAGARAARSGARDRARSPRARHDIALVAHAGDGNTHPIIVYTPRDPDETERAPAWRSARSWTSRSNWAARSPASTASAGSRRAWLPAQLGAGRHGPDPPDQGRARPRRHPQPRRRARQLTGDDSRCCVLRGRRGGGRRLDGRRAAGTRRIRRRSNR